MKEYNKPELVLMLDGLLPDIATSHIDEVVTAMLAELQRAIIVEERVELHGFGVFTVKERSREQGTMPEGMKNSAGVEYDREADYTVEFTLAQAFYDDLNTDEFIDPVVEED